MFELKREWKNISPEEYHASPGLSSTALRCFIREGKLDFYAKHVARLTATADTEDFKEGRCFHKAMEKPDSWEQFYATLPEAVPDDDLSQAINLAMKATGSKAAALVVGSEWNWKMKAHQEYRDAFDERARKAGKEFVTFEQLEMVKRQVQAVWDNPACRAYLEADGQSEVACYATAPDLPFALRSLVDKLLPWTVIDFKKTRERHPNDFVRSAILKYGYDWQGAYYCYVTGREEFRVIAVTDQFPYEANCYVLPEDLLQPMIEKAVPEQIALVKQVYDQWAISKACGETVDSQGVPADWHNEDWGAELELSLRYVDSVRKRANG